MFRHYILPLSLLIAMPAFAGVGSVKHFHVKEGMLAAEYKVARYGDDDRTLNHAHNHELEVEYGVSDRLAVAGLVAGERTSDDKFAVDGFGAEAMVMLTEQGDWWMTSGLLGEYFYNRHGADDLEAKLLLEWEDGLWNAKANLNTERGIGAGREKSIGIGSALQVTHAISHHAAFGAEWHAGYACLNRPRTDVEHYVGPVITGALFEFEDSEIEALAGYYWGFGKEAADNAMRFELEYAMEF